MTEMRKDRRAPASLKVKYKSATVDDFIEQFGTDVSRGGIFIKTKKPLEAGALLKFEFQLQDGSAVLHGVGRVAWRRLEQSARPDLPAGMGIKFFKLSDHSRVVVERIESRFGGNKSRYELTDAAEFAAPMSGPPTTESGSGPLPGNGKRGGAGSAPRTLPPPPAFSSIPPALKDVPRSRVQSGPFRPSLRNAGGALPKGTIGSFFPETSPRKSTGSPLRTSGSPASRSGDASEFLASAFQAGGAGPEVRAQARAQAERARRDPESIDLARELFGDAGDGAAQAARSSAPAGVETNPNTAPTHRPPPSGTPDDADTASAPVPAVELPRSPSPRGPQPSLAARIPSMEQLVDEAGRSEPATARGPQSSAAAAGEADSQPSAATKSGSFAPSSAAPGREPLKLAMSVPTFRPPAAVGEETPGRSRTLLMVALASTLVLGGVGAYVVMQRSSAERERNTQAALDQTPPAATPTSQDLSPAAPASDPTAQPAAAPADVVAPVAGPDVPVAIQAKPRNAEVWFAGKQQGTVPFTAKLPSNVPIEVSVRSAGFATVKRSITPKESAAPEVFELAPLPYQLVMTSEPEGATVASAGKTAVSPAPLELGHLESMIYVTVDKEGFQRGTRSVRLDEFHEQDGVMRAEIALSLAPAPVRRRAPPPVRAVPQAPAGLSANDAPPAPEPSAPPVMQVKPETDAPTAEPEAKVKPAEPPQTVATPEPPATQPEPAPN